MSTLEATELDILQEEPVFPENETGLRRKLDYFGYAPCPMRTELRRRLHREFLRKRAQTGIEAKWYIPAGCQETCVYEGLGVTEDESALPGLISEVGFGDFNRPAFVKRWLDTGVFASTPSAEIRAEFHEAGLVDSRGQFRVYAANVELLLIDRKRLGDRPVPRTWRDVLDPRYRGDVVISGEEGDIHESFLYGLHRDHGEAALEALGGNVKGFMHPAEMAKAAGTENPKGAAIYILPWFFAKGNPHQEKTLVVWPEEGAYLTPLYLLRKEQAGVAAHWAFEYFTGAIWAGHLDKIGFAPARAGARPLPGKLRWLGWDYVRRTDLEALREPLNAAFVRGRRR